MLLAASLRWMGETHEGTTSTGDGDLPPVPMRRVEEAVERAVRADDVVRAAVADLLHLPQVARAAVALTEGGGRRLRFVARARDGADPGAGLEAAQEPLDWCHIDAYDDVPLTDVVRTGRPVFAALDTLEERWPWLAERERAAGHRAAAVVPMLGAGARLGGLYLLYDRPQEFGAEQREALAALARRTAAALHEVSARRSGSADALLEDALDHGASAPAVAPVGRAASLRLLPVPTAPREARAFLAQELRAWGVAEEAVETAQLCLSEVVTNAVHHAHTVADLRVSLVEGVLTVVVRDFGAGGQVVAPVAEGEEDPLAVYGRGLMLVEAMADRWGSEHDVGGTTVWFSLDLVPSSA